MANHESEISVAERQLYILSLLSQNPIGYTTDEIVEKLKRWGVELTKRTIQRDIDELSMSYAIEEDEREGKSYYMARKFSMKNVDLTTMDMMAITFMQQLVAQYDHTMLGEAAGSILKRMTANTGNLNKKHLESLGNTIQFSDRNEWKNQDVNPEIEQIISAAIEKQTKLKIQYYSWNSDEVTTRIIHPYSIVFLDQYLNVEGYCELRKEVRTFRLSRIKQITVQKETFEVPNDYERRSDDKFIYISGDKPEQLRLLFNQTTGRYIREYQSHRADRIIEGEQGLIFEKTTTVTDEVRRWILQFGAGVQVIEPVWLAEDISREAQRMVEMYH
jgi:proteasome accessory factor B